jgi:26S proteasome subunit RPN7
MQIKILDALASLAQGNYKEAAIKLTNISIIDETAMLTIARPKDLAFYAIICAMKSMSRSDIKTQILSASGFKNLMEMAGSPQTEDVLENFLNGRYMDF